MHALCAPAEVGAAFYRSRLRPVGLIMIQTSQFKPAPSFHHLVSISRRRGFGINCTCQVRLGSRGVMAAQGPHAASPESAENYSTTCQFYCVVITESHQQTLRIHCLLRWCGGVNLRSGEISFLLLPSVQYSVVCILCQSGKLSFPLCVVGARLLCMLCCRGSGVDVRLSCCHGVLI